MTGTTISGSHVTLVSLSDPSYNPVYVTGYLSDSLEGFGPTAWTITNAGTIASGTDLTTGVVLGAGGQVTNLASGTITASSLGVQVTGGVGTANNLGLITTPGEFAVQFADGGSVINGAAGPTASSATIYGKGFGVDITGATGTVVNFGTIESGTCGCATYDGVYLGAGGSVTNAASATIIGFGFGVSISGGTGTVVNAGTISATYVQFSAGVELHNGGSLQNDTSGVISGYYAAVLSYADATVTNLGSLIALGKVAAGFHYGGTVINGSTLATSALISADGAGIVITGGGSIANYATIAGGTCGCYTYGGIYLSGGGGIANAASGTIVGYSYGVGLRGGTTETVVNEGTILGYDFGIRSAVGGQGATITNSGVIGSTGTNGAAIYFTKTHNRLIVDPGASFLGAVISQNGDVLELASGTSGGTISGIGASFAGFATITADSSATWTLSGNNTIGSGSTLINSGSLTGTPLYLIGGILLNQSGGLIDVASIYGNDGGGAGITNRGTITNVSGSAIYFRDLTGTVTGGALIDNFGTVKATESAAGVYGIQIAGPGTIHNEAASSLIQGYIGVGIDGAGTVINAGTIASTSTVFGVAVQFRGNSAKLIVDPGAQFVGGIYGKFGGTNEVEFVSATSAGTLSGLGSQFVNFGTYVVNAGATWTLSGPNTLATGSTLDNSGTLTGDALHLKGAYLLNQSNGLIEVAAIVGYGGGAADSVTNRGTITNASGAAIILHDQGNITNASSALIEGGFGGVKLSGTNAAVANLGTIVSGSTFTEYGVYLGNGGLVANGAPGSGTSTAVIQGYHGIRFYSSANLYGTLTNYGTVVGTGDLGDAVMLIEGGTVVNGASGATAALLHGGGFGIDSGFNLNVDNFATISATGTTGGEYGVRVASSGTVRNLGTAALIQGYTGVKIDLDGTVINAGTIASTRGTIGTAVSLTGGNARMVADPGAQFIGYVYGGSGGTNVLELASATSAGTLAGIGTQFVRFGTIAVDAGAAWTLVSNNTIGSGATLTAFAGANLTDTGALENDGAIVLNPSNLLVADLIGSGSVTFNAAATFEVQGSLASGETLAFVGGPSYAHFDSPTHIAGSVTNFGAGDAIDLKGIDPASVTYASGQVSFTGGSFALSIAAGSTLHVASSSDGAVLSALCFCRGTRILTPLGERRVQDLAVGDLVTTHRGEARPIMWIGKGKVLATRGRRNAATPIIVRKDALAPGVPHKDLHVTKGHALWLDDALIPVEFLVNHRSILWDDHAQEVELYHIELATHDVLVANGAAAESYRDDGNRWLFQNARSGLGLPAQQPYAAILTGGPRVDEAWRQLLERAGPRPGIPLTDDPDLHLVVDGRRLNASSRRGDSYLFRLSGPTDSVRMVSRVSAPQELGLARDPRLLGVALRRIVASRGAELRLAEPADASFAEGFHEFEAELGLRWTNGSADVPPLLFRGWSGTFELALELAATTRYLDEGDKRQAA